MLRTIICLIFICLSAANSQAQLNNNVFSQINWNDSIATGGWGLKNEVFNYVRNTEYTTKLDKGATLLGFQLIPTINYRPFDSVQFSGGVFLKKDLGSDAINRLVPIFSLTIRNKGHRFIFGNLEGSTSHGLIEPMYHFERIITNRVESGLQHVYQGKRIKSDFWIDWEKMIYQKSPYREEFTAGYSGEFATVLKKKIQWSFPLQVTAHHRGGEIDASPLQVESQYNFAYGNRLCYLPQNSFLKKIELQGYLTYYEDKSRIPADSFIDGLGQYVSLLFQGKHTGIMLNYWDAHQYESTNGDPVFRSLSIKNTAYIFNYRKMVSARFLYERELFPSFYISGRFNLMYDLHQKSKDMVMEVYLRYCTSTAFKKRKTAPIY